MAKLEVVPISAIQAVVLGFQGVLWNSRTCLYIALFTMILPQVIREILFSPSADALVSGLWSTYGTSPQSLSIEKIQATTSGFLTSYFFYIVFQWFCFVLGYFSLIELFRRSTTAQYSAGAQNIEAAHTAHDGASAGAPQMAWQTALRGGLRHTFPKGWVFSALAAILAAASQAVHPILIFLAVLASIGPVLIAQQGKGAFAALRDSVLIRYIKVGASPGTKWAVFFAVSGTAALLYLAMFCLQFVHQGIVFGDEILSVGRWLWNLAITGLPIGPTRGISLVVISVFSSFFVCVYAAATCHLHYAATTPTAVKPPDQKNVDR